jgi:hypothetical protein
MKRIYPHDSIFFPNSTPILGVSNLSREQTVQYGRVDGWQAGVFPALTS